ncbi:KilA-N domain-containing protein [Propionivibrio sp.]|uniref:KilA-N domain-containing protein n=1 Tax=Propionivibrio sp. TaxID=2212460 RepID=UPI00260066CB|nr:KilA-N domain-containing protein [Propionivibrio sp.]MBK7357296.1 KilA-N domain-containing protein [Propionivibrio sp.]
MSKDKKSSISVQGTAITILSQREDDYISLTDIARYKDSERTDYIIQNWMRNRNTIEFLGLWERLNNPGFNPIEFDGIKNQIGLNSFVMTAKRWIEGTGATGLISKPGRYGGTFAHKDIAFEFASWVSVEFKLYLIKEFQRLKDDENSRLSLAWNLNRTLSKLNYRIHTDAIKAHLIPAAITPEQARITYANEADVLNVAMFGQTAKAWRDAHPKAAGNMRDEAGIEQLLVLANLESLNAEFIRMGLTQGERLQKLNATAIRQLQSLSANFALRRLGGADEEPAA